jgi:hypothetical protein
MACSGTASVLALVVKGTMINMFVERVMIANGQLVLILVGILMYRYGGNIKQQVHGMWLHLSSPSHGCAWPIFP